MTKYEPSKGILAMDANQKLWPCPGIGRLVLAANEAGWTVAVDLGGDEREELEEVSMDTARLAVNEVEEATLAFIKEGERRQYMSVIPSNGSDWCCDYTLGAARFLDALVHEHVYPHT